MPRGRIAFRMTWCSAHRCAGPFRVCALLVLAEVARPHAARCKAIFTRWKAQKGRIGAQWPLSAPCPVYFSTFTLVTLSLREVIVEEKKGNLMK